MKYGKKTFFTLIITFLVFINVTGVLFALGLSNNNANTQKQTYQKEYTKLANTIEVNFNKIIQYQDQDLIDGFLKSVLAQYANENLNLEFRNAQDMLLYSSFFEPQIDIPKDCVEVLEINSVRCVVVSSMICDGEYQMIAAFNVEEAYTSIRSTNTVIMVTSVVLSILFSVLVYLSFKRQSKLLEATYEGINKIASGDFTSEHNNINVRGYRDFAQSFELLCQTVNGSVEEAQKEARISRSLVDMTANTLMPSLESIQRTAYDMLSYSELGEKDQNQINYISREAARVGKNAGKILAIRDVQRKVLNFAEVEIGKLFDGVAYSLSRKIKDIGVKYDVIPTELKLKGDSDLLSTLLYEFSAVAVNSCISGSTVSIGTQENMIVIKNDNAKISQSDVEKLCSVFECGEYDKASLISHLRFELCKQILDIHGAKVSFEYNYGLVIYVTI